MIELTPIQARILASLVEKEATVPETYPLTVNSLKLACNQKSNRTPVMNLEEGVILHTLKELKEQHLVMIDEGSRVFKYAHRMHRVLEIDRNFLAILTVMILRGEQTLNEIYTRVYRIFAFTSKTELQECLLQMIDAEFITLLPKKPGAREVRYRHNLCGKVDESQIKEEQALSPEQKQIKTLIERVDYLHDTLIDLTDRVEELLDKNKES